MIQRGSHEINVIRHRFSRKARLQAKGMLKKRFRNYTVQTYTVRLLNTHTVITVCHCRTVVRTFKNSHRISAVKLTDSRYR